MKLGTYSQSSTDIPATTAAYNLTAIYRGPPDQHTWITNVQYFGGDDNEFVQLFVVPTNTVVSGQTPTNIAGSIAVSWLFWTGTAIGINQNQPSILTSVVDKFQSNQNSIYLPAGYVLCAACNAENAAALNFRVGGFALE